MGNDPRPSGEYDDWSIAGFGTDDGSTWYVNSGETIADESRFTERDFNEADLDWVDSVTVHIVDENGIDHYFTLHGPWDDLEDIEAQVDDMWEAYGGEAA